MNTIIYYLGSDEDGCVDLWLSSNCTLAVMLLKVIKVLLKLVDVTLKEKKMKRKKLVIRSSRRLQFRENPEVLLRTLKFQMNAPWIHVAGCFC